MEEGNRRKAEGLVWVDPRSDPKPPTTGLSLRVTDEPSDITGLIEFCKTGRVYAVERWIKSGRPLQATLEDVGPWHHPTTPLVVAIESSQHDLALLLLCNGYNTEVEPPSTLNLVLERRAWEFLELLLAWGADPKRADPYHILDTYQSSIMERFWGHGVDFSEDNTLASYLASSTRNKPAYGFAKRHQSDPKVAYQLAFALGDAVSENQEKATSLLLWAGANPHRQVPSLRWGSGIEDDPDDERESAIECAVRQGHGKLLRHLKPDPAVDDFDELYGWVCDPDTVDHLFDLRPPDDWSQAIVRNSRRMGWWYGDRWAHRSCLERIFEHHWGRLNTLGHDECQGLRRGLLKMESDSDLSWLLQKLSKPHHCDAAIFRELTRTPAIKERMDRLGLSCLLPIKTPKRGPNRSPASNREDRQRGPPRNLEEEWLNSLDPETRAAILRKRISREQLHEEVWAEPVIKVAERYGVSDVAVAKWCKKLNVPRPGRGYWARKNAGQGLKKLALPKPKVGQQRYVHRPESRKWKPAASTHIPGLELFKKSIPVPAVLDPEHPLVSATRSAMKCANTDTHGIVRPHGDKALNILVSRACVERALRIMNALIDALQDAGFKVETAAILDAEGQPTAWTTSAVIYDERILFSLTERVNREERAPTDEERAEMRRDRWKRGPFFAHRPTGELIFQIESSSPDERHRRKWSDGKPRPLEESLYSFVRSLLISADAARYRQPETED